MHKKILIVSGCSWTDPNQLSEDINVSDNIVQLIDNDNYSQ